MDETQDQAPATVTVEAPAEHEDLMTRIAALLKDAEADIVDNMKAGFEWIENMWKERKDAQ
jgi:hypothetical protein